MKAGAAIAWEPNRPLEIEEVDLDGPKDGEVLIRLVTTSLCHTDVFTLSGKTWALPSERKCVQQPGQKCRVEGLAAGAASVRLGGVRAGDRNRPGPHDKA